ncbi:unnamed protein product, partial [Rotaria magnacalcarata]
MDLVNDEHQAYAVSQHDVSTDHDDSTFLFRQSLLPYYGPELPHPCEHLLLDENIDRHIVRLLASYSVDINRGFLPSIDPLPHLPLSSKFACWELLMVDLTRYLHA